QPPPVATPATEVAPEAPATAPTETAPPTISVPAPTPAAPAGPVAPRGAGVQPVDPGATVEWSSTEVAALGLEGANVAAARPAPARVASGTTGNTGSVSEQGVEDEWDDAWDSGEQSGELLQPVDRGGRAPRWQIALVAILLVAVIVALVVALTGGDDPTPEQSPTPTDTTKSTPTKTTKKTSTTSAVPSGGVAGTFRFHGATVRVLHG
ncbi:hypothetical protein AB0L40_23960, partial [Patulibacter sp. NPDC049589]